MEDVPLGGGGDDNAEPPDPTHQAVQLSMGTSAPMTVLQLLGGQSIQVQGVIQTAQSSVIQAPQIQSVQVSALSDSDVSQDSSDSVTSSPQSRDILSRRPSYRKILNELSSGQTVTKSEGKGDDDIGDSGITTMSMATPIYQTNTGQYIAIAPGGTMQGLQALSMTNTAASGQQGTTILQYAQTADGQQILVPSNQVVVQTASGDMQTYQIRTTNSLPQSVMMASPMTHQPPSTKTEDATLKREIRLMKNREAARECRRKKKEYVKCLENRVAVLESQNKTLIEELKTLKDIYCNKTG